MFSLTSLIPGIRQHIPRTISSISTPAIDALYNSVIISKSHREFILHKILAFLPVFAISASLRINLTNCPRK